MLVNFKFSKKNFLIINIFQFNDTRFSFNNIQNV